MEETTKKTDPRLDLHQMPTAVLLDMLHENQLAWEAVSGNDFDHPNKAHYATHFYNLRYAVARELERRGVSGIQGLPGSVQKAVQRIARGGAVTLPEASLLRKAVALAEGERWITVHPHGDDSPGVPVLIRETPDGGAHIIGGAGGSLNFVKLTNVKTAAEHKEQARSKAAEAKTKEKERVAGLSPEDRAKEKETRRNLGHDREAARLDAISKIYAAVGKEAPKIKSAEEIAEATGVDVAAAKIARRKEIAAHLSAAKHVADLGRESVLSDHDTAAKAGLGDLSLGGEAAGLLFSGDKAETSSVVQRFKERAKEQGASEGDIKAEAQEGKPAKDPEKEARLAAKRAEFKEQADKLKADGVVGGDVLDNLDAPAPEKVMEVLRAHRELQDTEAAYRKQKGNLRRGLPVSPMVVDTGEDVDAKVASDLAQEAEVRAARGFLAQVEEQEGLAGHVRAGAFDALVNASLVTTSAEVVSRDMVDAFGAAGAAQILAEKLRKSLSPEEFEQVGEAVANLQAKTAVGKAKAAMDAAGEHLDQAKALEIGEVGDTTDVVTARALNEKRLEHAEKAREILGSAYGEVGAVGMLSLALKSGAGKPLRIDMGAVDKESAVTMARSFGLLPAGEDGSGDYQIDSAGKRTFITLLPSAIDKLTPEVDPSEKARYEKAVAIKRGDHDEEGWLPKGIKPNVTLNDGREVDLSMSGEKVKQQRAIKMAGEFGRVGLHLGAGSGKSLTAIGAFTNAHEEGKAKKGVFAVPSIVHGQFSEEIDRFADPKFKHLSGTDVSRDQRMAAYKDPNTHMVVTTHHQFRDDLIHAMADHRGEGFNETKKWFEGQPEGVQRDAMKAAMDHHGWNADFFGVDEAHGLLNRQGKEDSGIARTLDAFSHHMPHYMSMTGTPVKNDKSEAHDMLNKIAPGKFGTREEFMRKYGRPGAAGKQALQRLMAPYVFTDKIPSGVTRADETKTLSLSDHQQEAYNHVARSFNKAKKGDVESAKVFAPELFEGQPEEEHPRIAKELAAKGLGGRKHAALRRVVDAHDYEHNAKAQALAADLKEHRDKPHVLFAHNYDSLEMMKRAAEDAGLRYGIIDGTMDAGQKAEVRRGFQPEDGSEPKYDVILSTDAGATGANLQRGTVLVNYDTPDTAVVHDQRAARIDRLGQKNPVTVRDYTTDTPHDRKARKRLARKKELGEIFQTPADLLDDSGLAREIQEVRGKKSAGEDRPGTEAADKPVTPNKPATPRDPEKIKRLDELVSAGGVPDHHVKETRDHVYKHLREVDPVKAGDVPNWDAHVQRYMDADKAERDRKEAYHAKNPGPRPKTNERVKTRTDHAHTAAFDAWQSATDEHDRVGDYMFAGGEGNKRFNAHLDRARELDQLADEVHEHDPERAEEARKLSESIKKTYRETAMHVSEALEHMNPNRVREEAYRHAERIKGEEDAKAAAEKADKARAARDARKKKAA